MNLELLNKIQVMLIEFANKNGISLQAEFGTVEKFKQFVMAFTVKAIVDICGMAVNQAWDIVFGSGSYEQLAESVWNATQPA